MSRSGGRVVECAGLEIRYTVIPYRGFESLLLRQTASNDAPFGAFFISTHQFTRHRCFAWFCGLALFSH